jgi:hypothetical protein
MSIRSKLAEIFDLEKKKNLWFEFWKCQGEHTGWKHLMSDECIDSPTRPNNAEELHEHGRPVRCLEYELGQSVSLLVVCSTWFDVFFIRKSAGGDVSLPLFYVWTTRI